MFDENVYKASVTGCTFSSAAGNATHAVVVNNNAGGIVVQGCSIDETYPNGIAILGNSGLYPNVIRDNDYRGPGNLLPIVQRPTVLANNMIAGSLDGAEAMPSYKAQGQTSATTQLFSARAGKSQKAFVACFRGRFITRAQALEPSGLPRLHHKLDGQTVLAGTHKSLRFQPQCQRFRPLLSPCRSTLQLIYWTQFRSKSGGKDQEP